MTIATDFSGISVTVHIGSGVGEPAAREHDDPQQPVARDRALRAVSNKLIESRDDAEFWIMVRRTSTCGEDLPDHRRIFCFVLTIDGLTVAMTMWRPSWGYPAFLMEGVVLEGSDHPLPMCRPFHFSAIDTSNEDDPRLIKAHMDYIKNLGTILVSVYELRDGHPSFPARPVSHCHAVSLNAILDLPELHKEALGSTTCTHKTSYGPALPPPPANYAIYSLPSGLPTAVYHFRYRSRDVLLRESIMPRPRTSPTPPENLTRTSPIRPQEGGGGEEDKIEDGDGMVVAEDHLEEMAARVEARRGFAEFVDLAGTAGSSSSSSRAPKCSRTVEVIDLTDE